MGHLKRLEPASQALIELLELGTYRPVSRKVFGPLHDFFQDVSNALGIEKETDVALLVEGVEVSAHQESQERNAIVEKINPGLAFRQPKTALVSQGAFQMAAQALGVVGVASQDNQVVGISK